MSFNFLRWWITGNSRLIIFNNFSFIHYCAIQFSVAPHFFIVLSVLMYIVISSLVIFPCILTLSFSKHVRWLHRNFVAFNSIPFRSIPFHSVTFRSIPFHSVPFRYILFHSVPFHSIPFLYCHLYVVWFLHCLVIITFSRHFNTLSRHYYIVIAISF